MTRNASDVFGTPRKGRYWFARADDMAQIQIPDGPHGLHRRVTATPCC